MLQTLRGSRRFRNDLPLANPKEHLLAREKLLITHAQRIEDWLEDRHRTQTWSTYVPDCMPTVFGAICILR
jgi:hypothetical protein